MEKLTQYAYLPYWYMQNLTKEEKSPLQTVLFVTDYCNLRCKHCAADGHAGTTMKSYEKIREELQYSYDQGSRFVDFEGGEPTLWKEGEKNLNDLIDLAKEIGFFSTTVTTNAQKDFSWLKADSIWVSVDGYRRYHDIIRGEGAFEKLNRNIAKSGHSKVSISMSVNAENYKSVVDVIRYAKENPAIDLVSFNFHTPYPGTESLTLDWDVRCRVIDKILSMKKQGYPIMNSYSGLRCMKKHTYKKYCSIANFILTDGTRLNECPGKTLGICDQCGFSMSGEMNAVMHLKVDTLLAGMKLRM